MKNLLFCLVFMVSGAWAKFYLDAGYTSSFNGQWEVETNERIYDFSGTALTGRAGATREGLMIGGAARIENFKVSDNLYDNNYTSNVYGLFIGYEMPSRVRIYADYYMGGTGEIDGFGTLNKPSGYTLGFGYRVFRHLSFNIESVSLSYENVELESTQILEQKYSVSYIAVGLSIPFEIGNI